MDLPNSLPLPEPNIVEQTGLWIPTQELIVSPPYLVGVLPDMRVISDYNHPDVMEPLFAFSFEIAGGKMLIATDGDFYWMVVPRGMAGEDGIIVVENPENVVYDLTTPDGSDMPFTKLKIQAAIQKFTDEVRGAAT